MITFCSLQKNWVFLRNLIAFAQFKIQNYFLVISAPNVIELKEKSKELAVIAVALVNREREVPDYIQMDEKNKIAKFTRVPKFSEIPYPSIMEPSLVIEYYSR